MKFKPKSFFILLVFIMFLSPGAVEANENTTLFENEYAETLSANINSNEEILGMSNKDENLQATNNGTFWDLVTVIYNTPSGSVIELEKNYIFDYYAYSDGIDIMRSITINGNGYTIDAQGQGRIFNIINHYEDNPKIYLNNITFKNGRYIDGGAIFNPYGELHISNSFFINNTASDGGGAIYTNNNLFIDDSIFKDNCAAYGGAITSIQNSNLYLDNVGFINNSAKLSAGAIYSMFSQNNFYNSYFINSSSLIGGAICDLYSISLFSNLSLESNRATKGASLYKMYKDISIYNSVFSSNQADEGGCLYFDEVDSAELNNVNFNNNAALYGGDIYYLGDMDNMVLTNTNSYDLFNISSVNLIREDLNYDIFEINNNPIVFDKRYDMRDYGYLTEVKDQLDEGNCWAFAVTAALESCILKANGTINDLSEQNLKNIVAMFSDYGKITSKPNNGGNLFMSIGYFASWLGPIFEENDVYSSNALSLLYDAISHIQNVVFIKRTSPTDNDDIKKAIVKYGAVVANMHYSKNYLNTDQVSYYMPDSKGMNHDIVVVGWDDTYSRYNFKNTPPGDGAFIIRNSWGPDWGEDGYFYLSYYDQSFANKVEQPLFTFVFNDTNHYDKNYQHEVLISNYAHLANPTYYIKNSFIAENDELISAVSTYFSDDSNYKIQIFVNNNLMHYQEGNVPGGYLTIPLTKYIPIKNGDVFDIFFEITNLDQSNIILYYFDYSNNNRIVQNGVSFFSYDGIDWFDVSNYNQVIPIKGFTKYGKLNTTIEVTGLDSDWTVGEEFTLVSKVKDQYGNYINEGNVTFWIDGVAYTVALSNYAANKTVSFNQYGKHNITVSFDSKHYYSSSSVSKLINLDSLSTSLSLYLNKDSFLVGDSLVARAVVNASHGKVSFYLGNNLLSTVNVNNAGVATYTSNSLVPGSFTLSALYHDDIGEYKDSSDDSGFSVFSNTFPEVIGWDSDWFVNKAVDLSVKVKDQLGNYLNQGSVTFVIDGVKNTVNINNYVASMSVVFDSAGGHNIAVLFNDVGYYYSSSVTKLINVDSLSTSLSLYLNKDSFLVGDSLVARAVVNASHGKVSFYLGNNLLSTVNVNNAGVASYTLNGLVPGSFILTALYHDDAGEYKDSSDDSSFSVFSNTFPEVIGWDSDWFVNKAVDLSVKVKDQLGNYLNQGSVTFVIDGVKNTVNINNYVASMSVVFDSAGGHNIAVLFNDVGYYYSSSVTKLINVDSIPTSLSLSLNKDSFLVGDSLVARAVVNASHGKVSFYLGNNLLSTVNVNNAGVASYTLNGLVPGSFILTAIYHDDAGEYKDSSDDSGFSVLSTSSVVAEDMILTVGDEGTISYITSPSGLKVTFDADDSGVVSVDKNGKVTALKSGTAIVTLIVGDNKSYVINSTTITVTVSEKPIPSKENLTISASAKPITVGEDAVVKVSGLENARGVVSVTVNGKSYSGPIVSGGASIVVPGLTVNSVAYVYYAGDDLYNSASTSVGIVVNPVPTPGKKNLTIKAVADAITVGDDAVVKVSGLENARGVVSVTVNGKSYSGPIVSGGASIVVPGLTVNSVAYVYYAGDDLYNSASTSVGIVVNPVPTPGKKNLTIKAVADAITVGEDAVIVVSNLADATGIVTAVVNGKSHTSPINGGKAVITVPGLTVNSVAYVYYAGDDLYNSASTSVGIVVNPVPTPGKKNLTIVASVKLITVGEDAVVKVSGLENAKGVVSVTVNGKTFSGPIVKGGASVTVPGLTANTKAYVNYRGDNLYNSASTTVNITVNPKENATINIVAPDVTKYYGGSERFIVTVTDYKGNPLVNKSVGIVINGVKYTRTTNANGMCSVGLNLPADIYNVTVSVDNATTNSVITILTTVNGTDLAKVFKNATQYYATFRDSEGKYLVEGSVVRFNINGVMYDRKVSANGLAKLNINLEHGKYIITAMNLITGEMSSNIITVIPSIIENNDLTKYYKNASQYTVKIIGDDGKAVGAGKSVTFNINGVFYTRQTNASGIAKLNINLGAGDYIITAEYNGCRISNNIKVLPVLVANDLVKRYRASNQFVAKLFDGQGRAYAGQSVQFNINGVLYNRVTDSTGQAKLNINLMAGVYIITSSYNGSNIANKITIWG